MSVRSCLSCEKQDVTAVWSPLRWFRIFWPSLPYDPGPVSLTVWLLTLAQAKGEVAAAVRGGGILGDWWVFVLSYAREKKTIDGDWEEQRLKGKVQGSRWRHLFEMQVAVLRRGFRREDWPVCCHGDSRRSPGSQFVMGVAVSHHSCFPQTFYSNSVLY